MNRPTTWTAGVVISALALVVPAVGSRSETLIVGTVAAVVDGDTLDITTRDRVVVRVRLWGIDAPETAHPTSHKPTQTCVDAIGRPYDCGAEAKAALKTLSPKGETISCRAAGIDKWKRVVAICATTAIPDIGRQMVLSGNALRVDRYDGGRYRAAQDDASASRRGIWRGHHERPNTFRRRVSNNSTRSEQSDDQD